RGLVLLEDRGRGRGATESSRSFATGARRALRHDAVGDRAPRIGGGTAADRHPVADRERARLRARGRAQAEDDERGSGMSTRVEVEEIQTTPSERLLAVVLAIFLLIGGIWTYDRIEEAV